MRRAAAALEAALCGGAPRGATGPDQVVSDGSAPGLTSRSNGAEGIVRTIPWFSAPPDARVLNGAEGGERLVHKVDEVKLAVRCRPMVERDVQTNQGSGCFDDEGQRNWSR